MEKRLSFTAKQNISKVDVCNLSVYGGVLSTDTIKNIRLYPMKKDMFDT